MRTAGSQCKVLFCPMGLLYKEMLTAKGCNAKEKVPFFRNVAEGLSQRICDKEKYPYRLGF